jgi:hypothetical protein
MNLGNKKNGKITNPKIVVNNDMKDHSNDPFFAKKAEASKKTIEKYGLPKQLLTTKK